MTNVNGNPDVDLNLNTTGPGGRLRVRDGVGGPVKLEVNPVGEVTAFGDLTFGSTGTWTNHNPNGGITTRVQTDAEFRWEAGLPGPARILAITSAGTYQTDQATLTFSATGPFTFNAVKVGGNTEDIAVFGQGDSTALPPGTPTLPVLTVKSNASHAAILAAPNGDFIVNDPLTVGGTLTTFGDADVSGSVTVGGGMTVSGPSTLTGPVSTSSTLTTGSTATVGGDLEVSGVSNLDGNLTVTADLGTEGPITVDTRSAPAKSPRITLIDRLFSADHQTSLGIEQPVPGVPEALWQSSVFARVQCERFEVDATSNEVVIGAHTNVNIRVGNTFANTFTITDPTHVAMEVVPTTSTLSLKNSGSVDAIVLRGEESTSGGPQSRVQVGLEPNTRGMVEVENDGSGGRPGVIKLRADTGEDVFLSVFRNGSNLELYATRTDPGSTRPPGPNMVFRIP